MRVASILLVAVYSLTLFRAVGPVSNFLANQEEIVELFCQNKDKPELECNGKCHLKAQFEQNAQDEEPSKAPTETEELAMHLVAPGVSNSPLIASGATFFEPNFSLVDSPPSFVERPPWA